MHLNDTAMMLRLYEHTDVEMDLRVLSFLIHSWASTPIARRPRGAKQRPSQAGLAGGPRGSIFGQPAMMMVEGEEVLDVAAEVRGLGGGRCKPGFTLGVAPLCAGANR